MGIASLTPGKLQKWYLRFNINVTMVAIGINNLIISFWRQIKKSVVEIYMVKESPKRNEYIIWLHPILYVKRKEITHVYTSFSTNQLTSSQVSDIKNVGRERFAWRFFNSFPFYQPPKPR